MLVGYVSVKPPNKVLQAVVGRAIDPAALPAELQRSKFLWVVSYPSILVKGCDPFDKRLICPPRTVQRQTVATGGSIARYQILFCLTGCHVNCQRGRGCKSPPASRPTLAVA
jgi:hypothetical protein